MKYASIPILATLALTGCQTTSVVDTAPSLYRKSPSQYELKVAADAVRRQVRDPRGMQVLSYAAYGQGSAYTEVCLGVNMRNGFGGYSGETTAHVVLINGEPRTVVVNREGYDNTAVERCVGLERNRAG